MGEPAVPSEEDRRARRELATAIVDSVRNDEPMPLEYDLARRAGVEISYETMSVPMTSQAQVEELAFVLAQEIVMLQAEAGVFAIPQTAALEVAIGRARAYLSGGESPPYKNDTTKLIAEALLAVADPPSGSGRPVVAAIMRGTTKVAPLYGERPMTATVGDLVFVELPPNCSIHEAAGLAPSDLARLVDCAVRVGEHWENQDGINAAYLDELADATKARR